MKHYIVEITDEALLDMEKLYNYISLDLLATESAISQYNRIADEILKLEFFPERFKIIDLKSERAKEIRKMPVDNYSVFYVIINNRVVVTDVLYSASDIRKRLR